MNNVIDMSQYRKVKVDAETKIFMQFSENINYAANLALSQGLEPQLLCGALAHCLAKALIFADPQLSTPLLQQVLAFIEKEAFQQALNNFESKN